MNEPVDILADFVLEDDFCKTADVSKRTLARYRGQPDGLPFLIFCNRVYIPIKEGREWLQAKIRRPNPRRRATA
jgi:hypothetical protein